MGNVEKIGLAEVVNIILTGNTVDSVVFRLTAVPGNSSALLPNKRTRLSLSSPSTTNVIRTLNQAYIRPHASLLDRCYDRRKTPEQSVITTDFSKILHVLYQHHPRGTDRS